MEGRPGGDGATAAARLADVVWPMGAFGELGRQMAGVLHGSGIAVEAVIVPGRMSMVQE